MNIYIASDHRGFLLKEELENWLGGLGQQVIDCGNQIHEATDDYPDFVHPLTQKMIADPDSLGIVICGSGIGVTIAANRRHHIRAGLCLRVDQAVHGRTNDFMNVLGLASDYTNPEEAKKIVAGFLGATPIYEEKYIRRVKKIEQVV